MIGQEQQRGGLKRRWGLPLGVAAAVSATGVVAAMAFSGGAAKTADGAGVGPGAGGATTATAAAPTTGATTVPGAPAPTGGPDLVAACKLALAGKDDRTATVIGGTTPAPIDPKYCEPTQTTAPDGKQIEPTDPVMTEPAPVALPAEQAAAVLASCAPSGGPWQPVIAVKTAVATANVDSMVIGTNAKHEYVFCDGLGNAGHADQSPSALTMATIRNGNSHLKEYDGGTDSSDRKNYLMYNWGLVGPEVARVTVSYGTEKREAPARLVGGAYLLTVSTPLLNYTHPPVGYVHAYAADGTKLYDTPLG
ncbi:hypothetical protein [Catenulispora subtropica]|uniref:Uncharacterized protein n=1 Tax=Catenulispora subtropica TaxID=450798 RepID=A0ABP5D7E7_9ACTN